MKILHYSLGFPPYRTGGLTKFCIDIMTKQKEMGHEVALLWPGRMGVFYKALQIKERRENSSIRNFEIINPLPISYDEGIIEIERFMESCNKKIYIDFLKKYQPDVIHVHTLMGLHKEFLEASQALKIRSVFTVHDFYTICPKVTLFRDGDVCPDPDSCSICPKCNLTALSMKKIYVLQSSIYRIFKGSSIVKALRQKHRKHYLSGKANEVAEQSVTNREIEDYKKLRGYYKQMISLFDCVHANSTLTARVFLKYHDVLNLKVISISHADIGDNKKRKMFAKDKLRITYLGPESRAKGFFLLEDALDMAWKEAKSFSLNIFFTPTELKPYMNVQGRYSYSELEQIFDMTDILVAPSIWYETFGYTVLEAMSYGVPVIVSDHVGAKDIISKDCGVVVEDMQAEKWKDAICGLTPEQLKKMNENIVENADIMTLERMVEMIMCQCYE